MSEQLLPNLSKLPHENWNDKSKVPHIKLDVKLHRIAKISGAGIIEPEDKILDSEFVG